MKFPWQRSSGRPAVAWLVILTAGLTLPSGNALAAAGVITEYVIPSGIGGFDIVAGPDGNLWVTEPGGLSNKVAKVTTSGGFTEYTAPNPPDFIAAGPDGNLWFTEVQTNKLGKVTTMGAFTEYAIPTANSSPQGIATGPDGNLWFIEQNANQVAKVTTSGSFTEYTVPTANSVPFLIAAGPDGNLWFTEYGGNKVAKVSTSGAFTEYPIPTANSQPVGITAGPDGNLWFTESNVNKVAKVTTSGSFTEYTEPTPNSSQPVVIAAGPDGNLWFTEDQGNRVAKVNTYGNFTEYFVPSRNSESDGITAGPDGNMWFPERSVGKVAKVAASTGLLRIASSPAVPTQIYVDSGIADSWGLTWLKLAPGFHKLKFTHVDGYTEPPPQVVSVNDGATTTITGSFIQRGSLRVITSPAVPSQIKVDGNPTDDWGMWTDIPTGSHTVCFGAVANYTPPPCQTATVTAGTQTTITGAFTASPGAPGQSGVGLLRVTTNPAVASQITLQAGAGPTYIADHWGLTWLEVAAGSYTVCFSHAIGWTEPFPCQTATVANGSTTTVVGDFVQRGFLRVLTAPAAAGTIFVDGIPQNDWSISTDIPTGAHTVCFAPAVGHSKTPGCQTVTVNAGATTTVTGTYS